MQFLNTKTGFDGTNEAWSFADYVEDGIKFPSTPHMGGRKSFAYEQDQSKGPMGPRDPCKDTHKVN